MNTQLLGFEVSFRLPNGSLANAIVTKEIHADNTILVVDKANVVTKLKTTAVSYLKRVSEDDLVSARMRAGMFKWRENHESEKLPTNGDEVGKEPTDRGRTEFAAHLCELSEDNNMLVDIMSTLASRGLDPVAVLSDLVPNSRHEGAREEPRRTLRAGAASLESDQKESDDEGASEDDEQSDNESSNSSEGDSSESEDSEDSEESSDDDDDTDNDDDDDEDDAGTTPELLTPLPFLFLLRF
mmetsp:Transcript_53457/g.99543  ORF Transcript_53457/g.99543 Transcript_53457/m.99543 type:complete len:241 (-) Transcript_53457:74-796(-)